MAKEIHVLLSRKSWEDLQELKKKTDLKNPIFFDDGNEADTYEEYLEKEKKNPTICLIA